MIATTPPTDQRFQVRPIAFVLDNMGALSEPVTLKIRPEELTKSDPSRLTVSQTLGKAPNPIGWVDNFGEGLPSVVIAGHTGWRATGVSQEDGYQSFMKLDQLVRVRYHEAKQAAIDAGADPGMVKLLFVDMLDDFTWSVAPANFVLRRSKSRPLLLQYNITLQAVSTSIDNPLVLVPFFGSEQAGLDSLSRILKQIDSFAVNIRSLIAEAISFVDRGLIYAADIVSSFTAVANQALTAAYNVVRDITDGATALTNRVINIARDIASVGVHVFRTFSAIANLPASLRAQLSRIAGAYNEVVCIFRNSLRPKKFYENYEDLYGASNCSSTTGGRPASALLDRNPFRLFQADTGPIGMSSSAMNSVLTVIRSDPVLAPMPIQELARHLTTINVGISLR